MKILKMENEFKININPSIKNLQEIEAWLIEEDRNLKSGFYCNWSIIKKAFENKAFICFEYNNSIIGFMVWGNNEIYANIDIFEIHPNYRKKGFGNIFYEKIAEYFRSEGLLAVKLFCSPIESEKFWIKVGFSKFPETVYESELTYFKYLIEINHPVEIAEGNKLELWDLEPHRVNNSHPKWTWIIENNITELSKPIINPIDRNWFLRLTKNNEIIKGDKVKWFSDTHNQIEYGSFLYIKKI